MTPDIFSNLIGLAYIDPGSGSLALQALLGVVAGGLALGARGWRKILGLFSRSDDPDASRKR